MKKALSAFLVSALLPSAALAEAEALNWESVSTQGWAECGNECALDTIAAARSVVIFHTKSQLEKAEAQALVEAIRRGARVELYVGQQNNLSEEVGMFADDIYQKWEATADESDTSMIGMGGCVMGSTDNPSFIVTDPFGWKGDDSPALVVNGKKTDQLDIAADASVVAETEDFIECKMQGT